MADGSAVNKHYDLTHIADLDVLMDDLVALLVEDRVPPAAVIVLDPGRPL